MSDPYQEYQTYEEVDSYHKGKGKGKGPKHPHPVVPEPSTYGVGLIGLILIFVLWRRFKK